MKIEFWCVGCDFGNEAEIDGEDSINALESFTVAQHYISPKRENCSGVDISIRLDIGEEVE